MRSLLLALALLFTTRTAAAREATYVGDWTPWIIAAGGILQTDAGTLRGSGSVRAGVQLGRVGDARLGVDMGGQNAIFAELLLAPLSLGQLSLGGTLDTGYLREGGHALLLRASPLLAYRPFRMHDLPVCYGCPVPDVHHPLQLELALGEAQFSLPGHRFRYGASFRAAWRF